MIDRKLSAIVRRVYATAFSAFLILGLCTDQTMAQRLDNDCKAIPKQVNDLVDKLPEIGERMGRVQEHIDQGQAIETNKHTLDTDTATVRKIKIDIDNLLIKLAPKPDNECEKIKKQINDLVDKLPEIGERMGRVQEHIDQGQAIETNKHTLDADRSTVRKIKLNIDNLLTKLGGCCKREQTSIPPTPTKPTPIFVRNYQPGEVFAGYMFLRAPGETAKNNSGFAVQLFYKFKPNLGIGGDLACAWGSGRLGTTIDVRLQRCTYAFGPQINTNPTGKVRFFFHPLVGGVHDANKTTAGTLISKSSADALMLSIGGGFDVKVSHRVEVRPIQVDFQPTHFGGSWQQNWRLGTGLVITFGKEKELPTW
jgi:hypothetical protein